MAVIKNRFAAENYFYSIWGFLADKKLFFIFIMAGVQVTVDAGYQLQVTG